MKNKGTKEELLSEAYAMQENIVIASLNRSSETAGMQEEFFNFVIRNRITPREFMSRVLLN